LKLKAATGREIERKEPSLRSKRNYQKGAAVLICAAAGLLVTWIISLIIR
jgi:hypothetical protein